MNVLLYYGLSRDEVTFCSSNALTCLKAYKLSWRAENLSIQIYPKSTTNDESDACRHYVWAILLSRDLGSADAESILNAHENNPSEAEDQKAMDLANNRLGLSQFRNSNAPLQSDEEILLSFKDQLKTKKLIVLNPKYKNNGGLP